MRHTPFIPITVGNALIVYPFNRRRRDRYRGGRRCYKLHLQLPAVRWSQPAEWSSGSLDLILMWLPTARALACAHQGVLDLSLYPYNDNDEFAYFHIIRVFSR